MRTTVPVITAARSPLEIKMTSHARRQENESSVVSDGISQQEKGQHHTEAERREYQQTFEAINHFIKEHGAFSEFQRSF